MVDSLVPVIKKEELETIALDFLRRNYQESVRIPMAIEPLKLAENMALREITEDFSVFGQIYFHDSDAKFYDKEKNELIKNRVNARTIFVDPKAYFLRNKEDKKISL